jgi:transposase
MSTDAAAAKIILDESTLPDDPETLKGMIRELLTMLHNRDQELSGVRQQLDQLLRRLYGPKGEHFRPDQPSLFEGAAEPVLPPTAPLPVEPEPVASSKRKGHGRRRLPADLKRERVVHDVSEAEKLCPCCRSPRVNIGEETSEQLDYRPAKLFVWEHVRLKYACPKCLKTSSETPTASSDTPSSHIVVAAKPAQPIDKGLPCPFPHSYRSFGRFLTELPSDSADCLTAGIW